MTEPGINLLGTAVGHMFEVAGKWWTLSPIGPLMRARFAAWCQAIARQAIISQRSVVGTDGYGDAHNALTDAIASGAYSWRSPDPRRMGRSVKTIMTSEDGQVRLMQLLLEAHHKDVTEEQIRELFDSNDEGMLYAVAGAMGTLDPNVEMPPSVKRTGAEESQSKGNKNPTTTTT